MRLSGYVFALSKLDCDLNAMDMVQSLLTSEQHFYGSYGTQLGVSEAPEARDNV
jgi:hypothetical protein